MSSKYEGGVQWSQTVNNRIPYVDVSLNSACADQLCYTDWTYGAWEMYLQRREYSPATGQYYWDTIGTRSGYVQDNSPSHRTFTNVGNYGDIRVKTWIKEGAYHGAVYLYDTVR